MTAQAIKSPEVTQAALSREDATFVAKNAGLVDHDQLMRLISVDAQIERCGTTDVTGMSDDQFLAHIFG
jgi:hypothetical protein